MPTKTCGAIRCGNLPPRYNSRRSLRSLYNLCRSLGSLRSLLLFAEPGCSCVLLVAWPKTKITLRQAARIIHKSWEG